MREVSRRDSGREAHPQDAVALAEFMPNLTNVLRQAGNVFNESNPRANLFMLGAKDPRVFEESFTTTWRLMAGNAALPHYALFTGAVLEPGR